MTYWGDDLASLFDASTPGSVTATFGAATAVGLLDVRDEVRSTPAGREVVTRANVLTLRNSDFSTLAVEDTVTIASVGYKVRDIQLVDIGDIKEVILATVTT